MDEDKVDLKVEEREEKMKEDGNHMEVSDEDAYGTNDEKEEEMPNNTKEEMPKNLSFVKGVVESNNLLTLKVNRENLHDSNTIKVIPKKLVRNAI